MLNRLMKLCREFPPAHVLSRTAWGETGQKFIFEMPEMTAEQQFCTWQVMVCRMRMVVLWADGGALQCKLSKPPAILKTPNAPAIFDGLFRYKSDHALICSTRAAVPHSHRSMR